MIVNTSNGRIKSVEVGEYRIPKKGEFFVPDDWGTKEIMGVLFGEEEYDDSFSVCEDPDVSFCLFEVFSDSKSKENKNTININCPEDVFDLLEI